MQQIDWLKNMKVTKYVTDGKTFFTKNVLQGNFQILYTGISMEPEEDYILPQLFFVSVM
jgi:hypothetical protein